MPPGVRGLIVHVLRVKPGLDEIFRFRYHALTRIFGNISFNDPTDRRRL